MNAPGIYAITHVASGRMYIGSAVCIARRWREHRSCLSRRRHDNPRLQNAWDKYGPDAFSFSVLEVVVNKSALVAREQGWIDASGPFYNILRVVGASRLGCPMSEESKARISAAKRGKPINAESRRGVPLGEKRRAAMATAQSQRRQEEQRKWQEENPGRNRKAEWLEAYKPIRAARARAKYAEMKLLRASA